MLWVARTRSGMSPATARIATSASALASNTSHGVPAPIWPGRRPASTPAAHGGSSASSCIGRSVDAFAAAQEHAADLEQRDVGAAEALVARDRGDQVRQQRRAHHRSDRRSSGCAARSAGRADRSPRGRARGSARPTGNAYVIASVAPAAASAARATSPRSAGPHAGRLAQRRQRRRHLLVADDAQDLLDHVDLAGDIAARRRRRDLEAIGAAPLDPPVRPSKPRRSSASRQVAASSAHAGQHLHARQPHRDRRRRLTRRAREYASTSVADHPAAADDAHAGAPRAPTRTPRARDRRRARSDATPRSAGPSRRAVRRTESGWKLALSSSDARGLVGDLGVEPAHHAGERDAARAVADHEVAGHQRARDAVERGELLAVAGAASRRSRRVVSVSRVERVQRLAELEHHVVRDVDEVRDRAHADARRRCAIRRGDGPTRRPVDHARGVARTAGRVGDRDRERRAAAGRPLQTRREIDARAARACRAASRPARARRRGGRARRRGSPAR